MQAVGIAIPIRHGFRLDLSCRSAGSGEIGTDAVNVAIERRLWPGSEGSSGCRSTNTMPDFGPAICWKCLRSSSSRRGARNTIRRGSWNSWTVAGKDRPRVRPARTRGRPTFRRVCRGNSSQRSLNTVDLRFPLSREPPLLSIRGRRHENRSSESPGGCRRPVWIPMQQNC